MNHFPWGILHKLADKQINSIRLKQNSPEDKVMNIYIYIYIYMSYILPFSKYNLLTEIELVKK